MIQTQELEKLTPLLFSWVEKTEMEGSDVGRGERRKTEAAETDCDEVK